MNRSHTLWTVVFVLSGLLLFGRAAFTERGMGRVYVREVKTDTRVEYLPATPRERAEPGVQLSGSRTLGLWLAALLTLAIFSFLYRDNPVYKVAESVMIGVSAAYAMVVGFWEQIVGKLLAKLMPGFIKATLNPDLQAADPDLSYLVPFALGLLLMARLSPVFPWLSRWPLAFIVGVTAGLKLVSYMEADFVAQIRNTVVPLVVMMNGQVDFNLSLRKLGLVVGVVSCLTYFLFSFEHRGVVGRVSRVGVWFLMITFGASFAFTVMGRITLLSQRFEFLFIDWLWLIDPTGRL